MVEKIILEEKGKKILLRKEEDGVMMSLDGGIYIISDVAAMLLEELNKSKSIAVCIEDILELYDVDIQEVIIDVKEFLKTLYEVKIISLERLKI